MNTEINFTQGENGDYKASSLGPGGRSIPVVSPSRQADKNLIFISNAHLGCLNGFIALITLYQYTYLLTYAYFLVKYYCKVLGKP